MQKRLFSLSVAVLVILLPFIAASQTPKEFVPVQSGFSATGKTVLPYAPNRVLVKFTESGIENSKLDIAIERGSAVPGTETGLSSIDALNRSLGVRSITRPFIEVRNKDAMSRLGIDRWYMIEVGRRGDMQEVARRFGINSFFSFRCLRCSKLYTMLLFLNL